MLFRSKSELRTVLEGERFLKKIDPSHIGTGDVFKETVRTGADEKALYYINIKAQCDLQRDTDPSLYLIVGQELIQKANGKIDNIHFSKGEFIEKSNHSVVAFIDGGKIVEFSFNMDLTIKKWSEYKEKRIGRLLPPYITRIQQRYALYLQRQGLPSIPNKAVI